MRRVQKLMSGWRGGLLLLLIMPLLAGCMPQLPASLPSQIVLTPGNYRLQWLQQNPDDDLIRLSAQGRVPIATDFISVGPDPIPEGAVLALYLHKDRGPNGNTWVSTPGPAGAPDESRFQDYTWLHGVPGILSPTGAVLVTTASAHNGRVRFEFVVSDNANSPTFCRDQHANGMCREDFGVTFLGQTTWLPAEIGKGGRPGTGDGVWGDANAWWHLCVTPGGANLPAWLDPDVVALVALGLLWGILFLPLSLFRLTRGFLLMVGAILVMTAVGWALYRFVFDPTQVTPQEVDLAKRQALMRMRLEWNEEPGFRAYGCANTPAMTTFANAPDLTRMSRELRVALIPCPSSSWGYGQPGAIVVWKDLFGVQPMFIFGAQWKLYQEPYLTLGRPTSQPYRIARNPDVVVQEFGLSQRIIYRQTAPGEGMAWIQYRKPLFWQIPNLFCIEGLTTQASCWEAAQPPTFCKPYTPFPPQTGHSGEADWLDQPMYLGGVWAPLNVWKSLALSAGLCLAFLLLVFWVRLQQAQAACFGCIGQIALLLVLGVAGASIMSYSVVLAYTDVRVTLQSREAMNQLTQHGSFFLPNWPISWFVELGASWTEGWARYSQLVDAGRPNLMMFPWLLWGGFVGLLTMPIWIGIAIGGEMGAWIGIIVELGLIVAGVALAPLQQSGTA